MMLLHDTFYTIVSVENIYSWIFKQFYPQVGYLVVVSFVYMRARACVCVFTLVCLCVCVSVCVFESVPMVTSHALRKLKHISIHTVVLAENI